MTFCKSRGGNSKDQTNSNCPLFVELCLEWAKIRTQSATLARGHVLPRRHWGPPTPSSTSSKWCLLRRVAVARSALGNVFPGCRWRPSAPLGASICGCCRNFHDLLPRAAVAVWRVLHGCDWHPLAPIRTRRDVAWSSCSCRACIAFAIWHILQASKRHGAAPVRISCCCLGLQRCLQTRLLRLRLPNDLHTSSFSLGKTRTQSATLACGHVLPRIHWGPSTPSSTSSKWCLLRRVAVARSALGNVFPGCRWRPSAPLGASICGCCRNFRDLLPRAAVAVWRVLHGCDWHPLAPIRTRRDVAWSNCRACIALAIWHILQASKRHCAAPVRISCCCLGLQRCLQTRLLRLRLPNDLHTSSFSLGKTRTQSATLACGHVLPRIHWGPPTPSSTSSKWCLLRRVAVARSALGNVFPGCRWRPSAPLGASICGCCRNFRDLLPRAAVAVWRVLHGCDWHPLAPIRTRRDVAWSNCRACIALAIWHILQASKRHCAAPVRISCCCLGLQTRLLRRRSVICRIGDGRTRHQQQKQHCSARHDRALSRHRHTSQIASLLDPTCAR